MVPLIVGCCTSLTNLLQGSFRQRLQWVLPTHTGIVMCHCLHLLSCMAPKFLRRMQYAENRLLTSFQSSSLQNSTLAKHFKPVFQRFEAKLWLLRTFEMHKFTFLGRPLARNLEWGLGCNGLVEPFWGAFIRGYSTSLPRDQASDTLDRGIWQLHLSVVGSYFLW